MNFVIVAGDPIDGLNFFGPFDSVDDAQEYADNHPVGAGSYWIAELFNPKEEA